MPARISSAPATGSPFGPTTVPESGVVGPCASTIHISGATRTILTSLHGERPARSKCLQAVSAYDSNPLCTSSEAPAKVPKLSSGLPSFDQDTAFHGTEPSLSPIVKYQSFDVPSPTPESAANATWTR